MIKIAQRGNFKGRDTTRENTVSYIEEAILAGYDVKIDVWLINEKWYLGHNLPIEEIQLSFMERPEIWTHARDLQGYVSLFNNSKVHTFWHSRDDYTFTSKNIKWAKSGDKTRDGIQVMPNSSTWAHIISKPPLGVCSDDFSQYEQAIIKQK